MYSSFFKFSSTAIFHPICNPFSFHILIPRTSRWANGWFLGDVNNSLFIYMCILRDLPQQKNPRVKKNPANGKSSRRTLGLKKNPSYCTIHPSMVVVHWWVLIHSCHGIAHERQIERNSSLVKGGYHLGFFFLNRLRFFHSPWNLNVTTFTIDPLLCTTSSINHKHCNYFWKSTNVSPLHKNLHSAEGSNNYMAEN
jgi:hypothetical protein